MLSEAEDSVAEFLEDVLRKNCFAKAGRLAGMANTFV